MRISNSNWERNGALVLPTVVCRVVDQSGLRAIFFDRGILGNLSQIAAVIIVIGAVIFAVVLFAVFAFTIEVIAIFFCK